MEEIYHQGMTLNQELAALGYTKRRPEQGSRAMYAYMVFDPDGVHVGTFTAHECSAYLRRTHPERYGQEAVGGR